MNHIMSVLLLSTLFIAAECRGDIPVTTKDTTFEPTDSTMSAYRGDISVTTKDTTFEPTESQLDTMSANRGDITPTTTTTGAISTDYDPNNCYCTSRYQPVCCSGTTVFNKCLAACDGMTECETGACDLESQVESIPDPVTCADFDHCAAFNDGCNTCQCYADGAVSCTRMFCDDEDLTTPRCLACDDGYALSGDGTCYAVEAYRGDIPVTTKDTTFEPTDTASNTMSANRGDITITSPSTTTLEPISTDYDPNNCYCTSRYEPVCCSGTTVFNKSLAACDGMTECQTGACDLEPNMQSLSISQSVSCTDFDHCTFYNDGCNNCQCLSDGMEVCTRMFCSDADLSSPRCLSCESGFSLNENGKCIDEDPVSTMSAHRGDIPVTTKDTTFEPTDSVLSTMSANRGDITVTTKDTTFEPTESQLNTVLANRGDIIPTTSTMEAISTDYDPNNCYCTARYEPVCCSGTTVFNKCLAACDGMTECQTGACDLEPEMETLSNSQSISCTDFDHCALYNDGCNDCQCLSNGVEACTRMFCADEDLSTPRCKSCEFGFEFNENGECVEAATPTTTTQRTCSWFGSACKAWSNGCNYCWCDEDGADSQCSYNTCDAGKYHERRCLECQDGYQFGEGTRCVPIPDTNEQNKEEIETESHKIGCRRDSRCNTDWGFRCQSDLECRASGATLLMCSQRRVCVEYLGHCESDADCNRRAGYSCIEGGRIKRCGRYQ